MKFRFREENNLGKYQINSNFEMILIYKFHPRLFLLEQRKAEAEKIRTKYPDRIPVSASSKC
jgi:hypothetical protein